MSFGAMFPTVRISATGSSKSVAIPSGAPSCHISNTSSSLTVYVAFGVGAATAVIPTADVATGTMVYAVVAYETMTVDVPKGANYLAVIASGAGPTDVLLTLGHDAA